MKPNVRPKNPHFSSGPCAKRPGWSLDALADACLSRSHRSKAGKAKLIEVRDRSRKLLGLPDGYVIGIVPGSDTGALEMAMWSLLGERGVDVLAWENFGLGWLIDAVKHLKLKDLRQFVAPYGELPDLATVDTDRDVVFTWNGTTSGICVPNGDWIATDRKGLTICDATSAIFAMDLPWPKLDVVTYSWQKVLGGEAAHGVIVLSPRAIERLERYTPPWPLPKVFRLTSAGKFNAAIFESVDTINTPSMLCVEDAIDALRWAEGVGALDGLIERSKANFAVLGAWVEKTPWIDFLASAGRARSWTSVCLKIVEPWFTALDNDKRWEVIQNMAALLEKERAALDINGHREAPAGLRIWTGATVERSDIEALLPWLDWAFAEVKPTQRTV
ncbi:MAG: phosphoserine transaminase [Alphaproteobacteria bacterium]|nr:phosphoserine transaminase [Alphaproteobacteria bacterium]